MDDPQQHHARQEQLPSRFHAPLSSARSLPTDYLSRSPSATERPLAKKPVQGKSKSKGCKDFEETAGQLEKLQRKEGEGKRIKKRCGHGKNRGQDSQLATLPVSVEV